MRPPISSQSWEEHRPLIQRLYVDQGEALSEVVEEVGRLTGFWATERQYKRRISAWSLDKNIKDDEMRAIIAIRVRRLRRGKQSLFYVRDRQVNPKKIARFARRKGINWNHYDEADSDHRMLSQAIRCTTPPSDGGLVHAPLLPSERTQHPQQDENEATAAPAPSSISHVVQKATFTTPNQTPTTVDAHHRTQSERIPVPNLKYIHRSLPLATLIRDQSPSYSDFDFMLPQARQAVVRTSSPPSLSTVISAPAYHRTLPEPPEIYIDFAPPHEHLHNEDHSNDLTPPKGGDTILSAGRNPTPNLESAHLDFWQNRQTLQHKNKILNERLQAAHVSAASSSSSPQEGRCYTRMPTFRTDTFAASI